MRILDFAAGSVSLLALVAACSQARAQDLPATGGQTGQTATTAQEAQSVETPSDAAPVAQSPEIVVTGIRSSLSKAADIKRQSTQVVDSIVAEDIGKFPDPTVAAALQRVPGVQVSVSDTDNEIAGPIIRGLGDILTTVNGREIFTGTGRGFAFQDLPAEALARADVYKSNSADFIEGGVAGLVNLQLHRPFDFKGFTISGLAQGTFDRQAEKMNPKLGMLVSDRWDTGIGEIGALIDVSYAYNKYDRASPFNDNLRSKLTPTDGADGIVIPAAETAENSVGEYQRPQVNASLQWKPSDALEFYADGLYAGYRTRRSVDFNLYDTSSAQSLSNIVTNDDCADYLIGSDGFYNADGSTEHLCTAKSYDANGLFGLTKDEAHHSTTDTYLLAGGVNYDVGSFHFNTDVSYTRSSSRDRYFILVVGKPVASIHAQTDVGGGPVTLASGTPLASPDDMRFTYGLDDGGGHDVGSLFAVKSDAHYDYDGLLRSIAFGGRFADRKATSQSYYQGAAAPGGSYVTPIAGHGLPDDFLTYAPGIPGVDGGAPYLVPDQDYLLDRGVEDTLRSIYGLPTGQPSYQPERSFDAQEKTYAVYAQAKYEVPLGGAVSIDGLFGARLTRTDRDIAGSGLVQDANGSSTLEPFTAHTSDTDILPNASARLRFGGGLQARFNYSKTLTRPGFGSLNPGINYTISTNQYILSTGSSGNPDLKPEKADAFDATLEYYFKKGSYISIGAYYKNIADRVTNSSEVQVIDGIKYTIFQPRNIGTAKLKGIEAAGQMFFDFLPGALSGLGTFVNFTLADSEVTTPGDSLEGYPLLGVSKYSGNAGLIYEKSGISARVVYSYRSSYNAGDVTPGQDVRPVDDLVYFETNHPLGRLDFGLSYAVTPHVSFTLDGSNVLNSKTKSFRNYQDRVLLPRALSYDASSFTLGARFTF